MAKKPFNFNLGNRALFPDELPAIAFLEQALRDSAAKNGVTIKQGAAHVRATGALTAKATVTNKAAAVKKGDLVITTEPAAKPVSAKTQNELLASRPRSGMERVY